jgi:hypothetical protein
MIFLHKLVLHGYSRVLPCEDHIELIANEEAQDDLYDQGHHRPDGCLVGLLPLEGKLDTLSKHVLGPQEPKEVRVPTAFLSIGKSFDQLSPIFLRAK